MKYFTGLLHNLNNKIDLPQPKKSRIMLEIAADLNDMFNYYIGRGFTEKEAAAKAKEKFELSDDIIASLSEIHSNLFRQWLEKTIGKTQDTCERILFLLLFFFLALSAVFAIITTPFFSAGSIFVYPVLAALIAVIIIWSAKFYQLYIKKDHNLKHLNIGMALFKYLGVAILFIGLSGYFIELYFYGSNTLFLGPFLIITIRETQLLPQIVEFLIKSSSLMMICMFAMLLTGMFWFTISQKISAIEQAEAEILLAE